MWVTNTIIDAKTQKMSKVHDQASKHFLYYYGLTYMNAWFKPCMHVYVYTYVYGRIYIYTDPVLLYIYSPYGPTVRSFFVSTNNKYTVHSRQHKLFYW